MLNVARFRHGWSSCSPLNGALCAYEVMTMKKEIVPLFEFGTWCQLNTIQDQELILLKGHLILDIALTQLYGDKLSFYGKAISYLRMRII